MDWNLKYKEEILKRKKIDGIWREQYKLLKEKYDTVSKKKCDVATRNKES